jgi:RNA 2',3'-cyclic 3'-phosphodiesterase
MHGSPPPPSPVPGAERLFLGVALPAELRQVLAEHLCAPHIPELPGRRVPPESWHLTLRFLGDTPPTQAERLRQVLRAADLGASFTIRFGAGGAFPRPARASVLWLGIDEGAEHLGRLAARVEQVARQAGFAAENRPFHPHLTLSRLQPPRDLRALLPAIPTFSHTLPVRAVVLFRSHLGRGPARYEAVEEVRVRR